MPIAHTLVSIDLVTAFNLSFALIGHPSLNSALVLITKHENAPYDS